MSSSHGRLLSLLVGTWLALAGCTASTPPPTASPAAANEGAAAGELRPAPRELGPTPVDEKVRFTVSLRLPDPAAVEGFLADVADPDSADYRRFLTAEEFGDRFGLPRDALAEVAGWLAGAGLTVEATPQRTSLAVSGPAGSVNSLLGVTLVDWQTPDGDRYHAPRGQPIVPVALERYVGAIVGLDSTPVLRPAFGRILGAGVPADGLRPHVVTRAYEIEPLHADGLRGEDQTIAIVSFDTFTPADLDVWHADVGISGTPVEIVRLPGAREQPGRNTGEVALDMQVIRGIAPAATIINYEGPNSADGFAAIIARIVADGRADIVSISWGLCETYSFAEAMAVNEQEFAAAFAAGISIFVASGDDGAHDCRSVEAFSDPFERDLRLAVSSPASSPSVIAVGGTFLSVRQDGTYYDEAGWEEPLAGGGGGGGLSSVYRRPAWQQGPGVDNGDSNGMRQLPDVAGPADPASGFFVIWTEPGQGRVAARVGGTSAAAPFWAASMLLARQLAEREGAGPLGALGPLLYQIAAEAPADAFFHDVVRGGNLHYSAVPGWDYSTGWGSPRVAPLARAIVDRLNDATR